MLLIKMDFVKLKEFTFQGLLLIWAYSIAWENPLYCGHMVIYFYKICKSKMLSL